MERKTLMIVDDEWEHDYEEVYVDESPWKHDYTMVDVVVRTKDGEFYNFDYLRSYTDGIQADFPIEALQVWPKIVVERTVIYSPDPPQEGEEEVVDPILRRIEELERENRAMFQVLQRNGLEDMTDCFLR